MTKQLYVLTKTVKTVVLADSLDGARTIANRDWIEIRLKCWDTSKQAGRHWDVDELERLPDDWDEQCIPFGSEDEKIIEVLVAEGCAPHYKGNKE